MNFTFLLLYVFFSRSKLYSNCALVYHEKLCSCKRAGILTHGLSSSLTVVTRTVIILLSSQLERRGRQCKHVLLV